MRARLPRPSATSLVAFILIVSPLVCVLSYAPIVRFREGPAPQPYPTGLVLFEEYGFYNPVEWLIDNTPLERPLIWWADLWGVGTAFESARIWRHNIRLRERRARFGPWGMHLSEEELIRRERAAIREQWVILWSPGVT